jgi:MFS transporter, AAHS family, 4-hydroxybenzoate transporter
LTDSHDAPRPVPAHPDGPQPSPVDVAAIIDGTIIGPYQRRVFALCFLVSALDGFDTQSIAFVAPSISAEWNLAVASFGPIFSATLLGSVIGASVVGRLADRYGRRIFTVLTVALFGIATLACAFCQDASQLLAFRLVAGLGLGGALPNFLALAAEYAPLRMRSRIVVMTMWGFPLGAVLGGALSTVLIRSFGWTSVFILGGALPLLLIGVLLHTLPESIRFLALQTARHEALRRLLMRLLPGRTFPEGQAFYVAEASVQSRGGYRMLFAQGRAAQTVLLSVAMFMSLLLTYLLINWMPLLLKQSGMATDSAVLGAVVLNLSGIIGSYVFSRRMDRSRRPIPLMVIAYVASACAVAAIGVVGSSVGPVMGSIFLAGFLLIGIQMTMSAFVANSYPTSLRGTGIGWNQGVGRLGSLLGPLIGGVLLGLGLSPAQLLQVSSLPALLAALALAWLAWLQPVGLPRRSSVRADSTSTANR